MNHNNSGWGEKHVLENNAFVNADGASTNNQQNTKAAACKRYQYQYEHLMASWNSLSDKSASNPAAVMIHNQIMSDIASLTANGCGTPAAPSYSEAKMHFTGVDSSPLPISTGHYSVFDTVFPTTIQSVSPFVNSVSAFANNGCSGCSGNCNGCADNANTLPAANVATTPASIDSIATASTTTKKRKPFLQWLLDGMK